MVRKKALWLIGLLAISLLVAVPAFIYRTNLQNLTGNVVTNVPSGEVRIPERILSPEAGDQQAGTQAREGALPAGLSGQLIRQILLLRKASVRGDIPSIAEHTTNIQKIVSSAGYPSLTAAWYKLVDCIYDSCPGAFYLDLIEEVELDGGESHKGLLPAIKTFRLWGGKNNILFSQAFTEANSAINSLKNEDAEKYWGLLVECNAQCSNFENLEFSLIESLVQ